MALKERNRDLKAREMYQTWLKEREKVIEQYKENTKLLNENTILKGKLIIKIQRSE